MDTELFYAYGRTDKETYRQTDRYDEANSRVSQFCERACKDSQKYCNVYWYSILNKTYLLLCNQVSKMLDKVHYALSKKIRHVRFVLLCSEKKDTHK